MKFHRLYPAIETPSRGGSSDRPALRSEKDAREIAVISLTGHHVNEEPSPSDWANKLADAFNAAIDETPRLNRDLDFYQSKTIEHELEAKSATDADAHRRARRLQIAADEVAEALELYRIRLNAAK